MPYAGNGTFNTLAAPDYPAVSGNIITASMWNDTMDDFATGLSNVICKDGQSTVTANIPFNNFNITGLKDPVNAQDGSTKNYTDTQDALRLAKASNLSDLASQLISQQNLGVLSNNPILDTGAADAYVVAAGLAAYATGKLYHCRIANANTGAAATIDFGAGAVSILLLSGGAPAAGDMLTTVPPLMMYNGAAMVLLNPQTSNSRGSAGLSSTQTFVGAQRGDEHDLGALSGTFNPDFSVDNNFTVTLNGNGTLGTPANLAAAVGQTGFITVYQDATGGWSLAFSADWDFGSLGTPSFNTGASLFNVIFYKVIGAGTKIMAMGWAHD